MSQDTTFTNAQNDWTKFLSYSARHSHILMSWCAVFLFPAFVLLDYLVLDDWEGFFIVRLCGMFAIVLMLSLKDRFNLSNDFIAHFSCHVVFVSLMWMLSLLKTTDHFFIYSFNTSVGYITSAIFLIWQPRHSIIIMLSTVTSFVGFALLFSPLSFGELISHGFLVLLAVMIISQLYVQFRYKVMFRDFVRQMELNHAYEELKSKNSEINQRNFEILLQKEKVEEINELKDRIFMIISRDFRTPLHSLKGLTFLLNDSDQIGADEFKMLLKGLRHNLDETCDLLENVQLWSKSQMKDFFIEGQKINVFDLVNESIESQTNSAREKRITLVNHVDQNFYVRGDVDMIRLVMRNLISNAIKFMDGQGRVVVQSAIDGRSVNISVIDSGIGMTYNQQAEVFTHAFAKDGIEGDSGTSLSLMICKELIEKNNGRIWLESELGKGNTFTFSLPASESQATLAINASQRSSQ